MRFRSLRRGICLRFVDRFLLDQQADTDVMYTDGTFEFDEAQWIDWTVPKLR